MGIEATRLGVLLAGTKKEQDVEYGAKNKVVYFSVDGSPVQPRRTVALTENCNNCHVHIAAHGQPRNQVEMCILCHNPSLTDAATRAQSKIPADLATPAQALNFNVMIHRIHTGENLQAMGSSYLILSHRGRHVDFSDVRYPVQSADGSVGDTRKCWMCHTNGSEQNLPIGLNLVSEPQSLLNPEPAVTAACTGCHVTKPALSHAVTNSNTLGESCQVCHGAQGKFNINFAHAE
jgi:OmcA/MtrC family decaheme c-type cytochrome